MKKSVVLIFALMLISSCMAVNALSINEISTALDINPELIASMYLNANNSDGYGAAVFSKGDFPTEDSQLSSFSLPIKGKSFLVLSSGDAKRANNYKGTEYEAYSSGNYNYNPDGINDLTQLKFTVKVPANATSFRFDFMFCSDEWPDFYLSQYNDAFVAERDSSNFKIQASDEYGTENQAVLIAPNNFALDTKGKPLNINSGFGFDPNNKNPDTGTVYGGCTVLLTASADVTNKNEQTIILSIFDASDTVLDSAVFIDNFRFSNQVGAGIEVCGEECTQQDTSTGNETIYVILGLAIFIIFIGGIVYLVYWILKKGKQAAAAKQRLPVRWNLLAAGVGILLAFSIYFSYAKSYFASFLMMAFIIYSIIAAISNYKKNIGQ